MKALILILISVGLMACNTRKSDVPNIELIRNMMESPAKKAMTANRVPPEGTQPIGFTPYPYPDNAELAEKNLVNPVKATSESLARGKVLFETYCFVCHGLGGKGDGLVAEKMSIKPPSLLSDKVRKFRDGRIFHIITAGQGVMNSYATQIVKPEDRWSVVNYVRSLQSSTPR